LVNPNPVSPSAGFRAPLLRALRPHQWVKNLFVVAPLVFARRIDDIEAALRTAAAVLTFCMVSSAVYLFNDLVDLDKDRAHPVKRRRPIAAGAVAPATARAAAFGLAGAALAGAVLLGFPTLAAVVAYLVLNIAYTMVLKRIAFVDVACLSVFFLIRVLAGAAAIPVPPSSWLLACTLLLALLLGFGKRAHELSHAGETGEAQRDVLGHYRLSTLRRLIGTLGLLTTATYVAYTQSGHAQGFFGTRYLALTTPFVAFGIHRFVGITRRQQTAESPTDSMLRDKPFMANLILYGVAVLLIIYLR